MRVAHCPAFCDSLWHLRPCGITPHHAAPGLALLLVAAAQGTVRGGTRDARTPERWDAWTLCAPGRASGSRPRCRFTSRSMPACHGGHRVRVDCRGPAQSWPRARPWTKRAQLRTDDPLGGASQRHRVKFAARPRARLSAVRVAGGASVPPLADMSRPLRVPDRLGGTPRCLQLHKGQMHNLRAKQESSRSCGDAGDVAASGRTSPCAT